MKKYAKSISLTLGLILTLTLVLTACSNSKNQNVETLPQSFEEEAGGQRTIRLGFEGGLCQAAIPVAHLFGFFEAEGLDTEIIVTGDMVNSRDSLVAGHIDTVAGMLAGWFVPVTQGIDLSFTLGLHTACASAFVLADSPITEFEAGQEIAISGAIGGAFHNIALRFIHRAGFTPDDFTWRDFPAAEAVVALQNGAAQVAVIPDQVGQRFVDDGILRPIRSLTDQDFAEEVCCVLGLATSFIQENPETAERISRAVRAASLWLGESAENKAEAVHALVDAGYIAAGIDVDYIVNLMDAWIWGPSNGLTLQTLEHSIDEYQSLGVIDQTLDPDVIKEQIWRPLTTD